MKLSFRSKLGYAAGGIADAANFMLVGSYILFFLTTVVGISPATAGAITGLGTIVSSLWGPVVGFLSDHTRSRFGRRRPYLMAAAGPLLLFGLLCFTVVGGSEMAQVLYYGVVVTLFWCSFSTFYCPWLALGAEYTADYGERTALRSVTYAVTQVGCIFGMAAPPMLTAFFTGRGFSASQVWQLTALVVGLAAFVALQATIRASKPRDQAMPSAKVPPVSGGVSLRALLREYWEVLRLKPTKYIIGACLFHMTAQSVFLSDRVYFFTYNVPLSPSMMTLMMVLFSLFSFGMAIPMLKLSDAVDKRIALIMLLLTSAALCTAVKVVGVGSIGSGVAVTLFFSLGNSAFWQLMPVMLYDICEYDEYQNNRRREGIVVSIQNVMETICTGLSSFLLGVILQVTGFVEGAAVQEASALTGVEFAFILLPAILMVLCALMIYRYPITKETFEELQRTLTERRQREYNGK